MDSGRGPSKTFLSAGVRLAGPLLMLQTEPIGIGAMPWGPQHKGAHFTYSNQIIKGLNLPQNFICPKESKVAPGGGRGSGSEME